MPKRPTRTTPSSIPHLVKGTGKSRIDELIRENDELRARLIEAEETLEAIRSGEVDAVVVAGPQGEQVFTLAATDNERQFHQLADSISNLAWMANADGYVFWYNRSWYEYTGTTPEQMEGWGWQAVHDPNELPKVKKLWQHAIDTGEPFEMTFPIRGADGILRPFLSRGTPLKDAEGKVVRWFGTNTDISEQKATEEALRQSERMYRAIGESINYGIWICDPDGRNTYASESFLKLVGLTQEQCSEFGWGSVLHPDDAERTLAAWKECVRTGGHWEIEHRYRGVDGQWHPILARGVPVRDDKGQITNWVGINLDMTKLKRAERALMRSEKLAATGQLAATIAHEINNPLEAVTNLLYLLRDEADRVRSTELVDLAMSELGRVSHIARQTLGFYRDSTAPQPVRLKQVIEETLQLYGKEFQARKLRYITEYQTDGEIRGYAGEMRQVFSNLIRNAIDAAPESGLVRVYLREAANGGKRGVSVFVCDNGPGISAGDQARIFEPFFTTKGQKGTGLGLWVAKDLVQKHGGFIRVRSTMNPDRRGTCFCVFIPSEKV